jgi:AraC-like DNA-binding protein
MSELHAEVFAFAQKAQALALILLEPDPMRRLPGTWDVLSDLPRCDRNDDRVVLSIILQRLAEAFFRADSSRELSLEARLRRVKVGDVHCARVLDCIRRDFGNPGLDLRVAATKCRLSAPYISHLLSITTRHGFQTHLAWIRILHVVRLLVSSTLSIEEIADSSGFKSTSVLDREFRKRVNMTPSEFRRWASS